jgi:toxin CptA
VKPIEINLKPSRALIAALSAMHLLAIAAVWVLSWPIATSFTVLVLVSFTWCWRRKWAVTLKINVKGELLLQQDGDWLEVKVLASSLVLPYLTVLNLKLPGRRWPLNIVLLPDSLDAQDYRKLRVWLRWGQDSVS